MKGIVAYDTVHGSTKAVAEAMAEQIRSEGHQAQLVFVEDIKKGDLEGDFLFIGSPTRGGVMTKDTKTFIGSLDPAYWRGKKVVTFGTVGPFSKDPENRRKALASIGEGSKTAANKMRDVCEGRGIAVCKTMHFAVIGMWGPIAPDEPELAKAQTHEFLAGL